VSEPPAGGGASIFGVISGQLSNLTSHSYFRRAHSSYTLLFCCHRFHFAGQQEASVSCHKLPLLNDTPQKEKIKDAQRVDGIVNNSFQQPTTTPISNDENSCPHQASHRLRDQNSRRPHQGRAGRAAQQRQDEHESLLRDRHRGGHTSQGEDNCRGGGGVDRA
jgi:hypothetical protein